MTQHEIVRREMATCVACGTMYERITVSFGNGLGSSSCPRCNCGSYSAPLLVTDDVYPEPDVIIEFTSEGGFYCRRANGDSH